MFSRAGSPGGETAADEPRSRLFPLLLRRRVQLSLFFFIPLFLILFSTTPIYVTVTLLSRAAVAGAGAPRPIEFQGAIAATTWVFVTGAVVALAAGLVIAYALVQPLQRLSRAMHGVAGGDLATRVRLDATDEFASLADEFNAMVSTLRTQEQLRRTEVLAALGTLAAGIAHEIRNPLGAVKGLAQLLVESASAAGERKYAETIVVEVDRLNGMVERLLDLARPGERPMEPIEINRLVREAVELSGYQRHGKTIDLQLELAPERPITQADGAGLLQAILNLLINAVQASADSGTIRVRTAVRAAPAPVVGIEVSNTGSSVRREDYKRIFDPFFTTKETGTGLGLTITHQIVTAHGGTIEVDSQADRTTFTIQLPLRA